MPSSTDAASPTISTRGVPAAHERRVGQLGPHAGAEQGVVLDEHDPDGH